MVPTITVATPKALNACLIAPNVSGTAASSFDRKFFNNLGGDFGATPAAAGMVCDGRESNEAGPEPTLLAFEICTPDCGKTALDLAQKNGTAKPAESTNCILWANDVNFHSSE
jgi:hypothetical protein